MRSGNGATVSPQGRELVYLEGDSCGEIGRDARAGGHSKKKIGVST